MDRRPLVLLFFCLAAGGCNHDALTAEPNDASVAEPIECPPPANGNHGQIAVTPSGASASFGYGGALSAPCGCRYIEMNGAFPPDMATIPDGGTFVLAPAAGTITVAGERTIDLSPDSHGLYPGFADNGGPIFATPARPLTIGAAGGDVPSFSAMLTTPADAVVDSPALPADGTLSIDEKQGLALTWHGADQLVEVDVSGSAFEFAGTLRCTFDGRAGRGFIASPFFGDFDPQRGGWISVQTAAATVAPAGDWHVLIDADRPAMTPAHTPYTSRVQYR